MRRVRSTVLFLASRSLSLAAASVARADVPDYQGKPYQGTPAAIPGRVELANLETW